MNSLAPIAQHKEQFKTVIAADIPSRFQGANFNALDVRRASEMQMASWYEEPLEALRREQGWTISEFNCEVSDKEQRAMASQLRKEIRRELKVRKQQRDQVRVVEHRARRTRFVFAPSLDQLRSRANF